MEQKRRHAHDAELTGHVAQLVDVLLHAVADEYQRVDLVLPRFGGGVFQHPLDLGHAAGTTHLSHLCQQVRRAADPGTRVELPEPAVVTELDVETAQRLGFEKHLRLDLTGAIPRGLPACGRIHGENQAPATATHPGYRRARDLGEKRVDLRLSGFGR